MNKIYYMDSDCLVVEVLDYRSQGDTIIYSVTA